MLYFNLLTSGKLNSYLADIDGQAEELFLRLVKQMAEREGVTEQLKAKNQMEWVRRINNIRDRVEQFVNAELIFNRVGGYPLVEQPTSHTTVRTVPYTAVQSY